MAEASAGQPAQTNQTTVAKPALAVKAFFEQDNIRTRFEQLMGKRAPAFITSILQLIANNQRFEGVDPISMFNAAATAATLDLPVNPALGYSWIVPYKVKGRLVAQFQIGAKGWVQLGQRSAQYARMNAGKVFQNQFKSWDPMTEELDVDLTLPPVGPVVGYYAYFKLINGFEKTEYWTVQRVTDHAKQYSKSFDFAESGWKTDFDKMAIKTVLKNTLAPWGPMSIDMQLAAKVDQAVITNPETFDAEYVDNEETPEEKAAKAAAAAEAALNGKT